jgi:uracil-DNA glycosylase
LAEDSRVARAKPGRYLRLMPNTLHQMLHPTWKDALGYNMATTALASPQQFLDTQLDARRSFYPAYKNLLRAFDLAQFDNVKVVILGQDPYIDRDVAGRAHADGLAFSVQNRVRPLPPSLLNIFMEIERDLGRPPRVTGNLAPWAHQGVLLLNTTLSVATGQRPSHRGHGWAQFTNRCVSALSDRRAGIVFLLWGGRARAKRRLIDEDHNLVLEAAHPSPRSVRGFRGCRHFSATNRHLIGISKKPIDW